MRRNELKRRLFREKPCVNAWCSAPSSYVAEVLAHLEFNAVTIDLQHGAVDYRDAFAMLQAISTGCAVPMVRIPWNDPAMTMKLLDAGAMGVICPMVNTADDALAFAGACRYPPVGYRSYGPNRSVQYAGKDFWKAANDEVLSLAMIETEQGLKNLEAIIETPGLDGVYVGPGDLSLALGCAPSMQPKDQKVARAIAHIASVARAAGKIAAVHTDGAETARERFRQGYQLCTLQSDIRFMSNGAQAELSKLSKLVE